ncbi:MAG: hypothetical protein V2I54_04965 [Bacteroidales bacterium]|jgi:hypothetical protein|nr:hypothetical protein [Bacteroidales bacterium]
MDFININVRVKESEKELTLVLYHKIYSTPDGIINRWSTNQDSPYKVELLMDGQEISIDNTRVNKDMYIISSEHEILDQVISKLFEDKVFEIKRSIAEIKTY